MKGLRLLALALSVLMVLPLAAQQPWTQYWSKFYEPITTTPNGFSMSSDWSHISVASDGSIYTFGSEAISRYTPDGTKLWTVPDVPVGVKCAGGPNSFYECGATPDGLYKVAKLSGSNGRVEWVEPTGQTGPLCVDSSDNVYFASYSQQQGEVLLKWDPTGKQLWQVQPYASETIGNLQFDNAGNLLVAGTFLNSNGVAAFISKYTQSGTFLWTYVETSVGLNYSPNAIAFGPDDSLYEAFTHEQPGGGNAGQTVVKIQSSGTLSYSHDFPNANGLVFPPNSDGTVYFAGNGWDIGSDYWYELSTSGSVVWTRTMPLMSFPVYKDANDDLFFVDASGSDFAQFTGYNPAGAQIASYNSQSVLGTTDYVAFKGISNGALLFTNFDDQAAFGLSKVSYLGSPIWSQLNTTNDGASVGLTKGAVSSTGTIFLASPVDGLTSNAAIAAFDANGNSLFCTFVPSFVGNPIKVIPTSDGGILAGFDRGLVRCDSAGHLLWTAGVQMDDMAVDSSGNILGAVHNIGAPPYCYGWKVSPTGTVLWKVSTGLEVNANYVPPVRVTVDSSNCLVVAAPDFEIVKLGPAGSKLYDVTYPGSGVGNEDQLVSMNADASGHAFMTYNLYTSGTIQVWTRELGPGGGTLWNTLVAYGLESPGSKALYDPAGYLYVGGQTRANGVLEMLVGKLDAQTGDIIWANGYQVGTSSGVDDFAFNSTGDLLVAGWTYNSQTAYDAVILRLLSGGGEQYRKVFDSGYGFDDSYAPEVHQAYAGVGWGANGVGYLFGSSMGPSNPYEFQLAKFGPPPPLDASITQTPPAKMVAGVNYSVPVTATNGGSNVWTAAGGYKLDCLEPSTWGLTSVALSSTDAIAFNQAKTFYANVKAPTTPGTYLLAWKMEQSGTQFGSQSAAASIQVVAQTNFASFVGQTVPTSMVAGQTYPVSLQYTNAGSNTWTPGAGYDLISVNPGLNTNWGKNRLPLTTSSVGPGQTATYAASITAPMTGGTYNFQWQPEQQGMSPYGPFSTNVVVTVTKMADAARFVGLSGVASTMTAGSSFSPSITFMNVGTNTWSAPSYGLKSRNPYNNVNWGTNFIPVPSSVGPGAQAVFQPSLKAPATPGTYYFQFSMMDLGTGVLFGDLPAPVVVKVTAPANWATYVTTNIQPTSINAGTDFWVQYTMNNAGTNGWSNGTGYSMMSLNPANNVTWNRSRLYLPGTGTVSPGSNVTITGLCMAPVVPGTYTMQWQMDVNGAAFGQPTPLASISVTQGPDDARYVSQSGVPTSIVHSTAFTATINMKNLGTATWDSSYALVPVGTSTFGITSIPVPSTASGTTAAITAKFTAPATAGTYHFQFRMSHNGVKFGQSSADVVVTVT